MLKTEEIRSMTIDEIDAKIEAIKKDSYTMRVQAKTGKLEKQHLMKVNKRNIARLLTVRGELQAQAASKKTVNKE